MKLPPWWLDGEPPVFPGDEFYIDAFAKLSTCRHVGMAPGPIPWRDIVAYADRIGLDQGEAEAFSTVIMTMDAAWRGFHAEGDDKEDSG